MKCPNCCTDIDDNSKFCKECGTQIMPIIEQESKTMSTPTSKSKKKAIIIITIVGIVIILLSFLLYPVFIHNQIKGTWYQTVYEDNDSYILKLIIDDEYIDYRICVDSSLSGLLGDDSLPINTLKYKLGWFGSSTVYLSNSSLSGLHCQISIWGDTLTISPSFGGENTGEKWGRFKGDEVFVTKDFDYEAWISKLDN